MVCCCVNGKCWPSVNGRREFCGLPALAVCEWKEDAIVLLAEADAKYNAALLTRVIAVLGSVAIAVVFAVLLPLDSK